MRNGLGGIQSVAIIGGSSDIGFAIGNALRSLGASRYVLAGRDFDAIASHSADLPGTTFVHLDIADLGGHDEAIETIFADGDLDVLVLTGGVLRSNPKPRDVSEMALVNGAGSISLLASIGEKVRGQGHGHVVIFSSMAIARPRPSNYWYGASKAGIDFAARGLADDLDSLGIPVSVVRPGFVHTKMTRGMNPAPFACGPDDVARAVAKSVANNTGGVVWVPGILKYVAVVLRLLPIALLRRLDS